MRPEDQAQELELQEYQRNQAKAIMPKPGKPSSKWCIAPIVRTVGVLPKSGKPSAKWCIAPGCGERIPDARRKAVPGVQHCLSCQNELEKNGGRRAGAN